MENIVYEAFLDECHGEQLALFADRGVSEFYAVEENVVAILDEAVVTPEDKAYAEVPKLYNTLLNEQIVLELERTTDLVAYHTDVGDVGLFGQLGITTQTFALIVQKTTFGSLKEDGATFAMPETLNGQPGTVFVLSDGTRWDQVASMDACSFSLESLMQLYLVQLSLVVEQPKWGLQLPPALKDLCIKTVAKEWVVVKSSKFHFQVSKTLDTLQKWPLS